MKSKTGLIVVTTVVLVPLAIYFLLPCIQHESDMDMNGVMSRNSLMQIASAFHDYYHMYKRLPPAVALGTDGKPLYSWRVLLLPFLEQDKLYKEIRLNEPWDSFHNRQLITSMPMCYHAPMDDRDTGLTRYQVFVGPGTAFELPRMKWELFDDGVDKTFLVVEAAELVPWTKPIDLDYDPNKPLTEFGKIYRKPFRVICGYVFKPGFNVAFADGRVRFIESTIDEKTLRALITRNGGEKVDMSKLGE